MYGERNMTRQQNGPVTNRNADNAAMFVSKAPIHFLLSVKQYTSNIQNFMFTLHLE